MATTISESEIRQVVNQVLSRMQSAPAASWDSTQYGGRKLIGIYEDMKKRDEQDSSRAVAPLKPAEDAVLVDTSGNTLQESIDIICSVIEQALEKTRG